MRTLLISATIILCAGRIASATDLTVPLPELSGISQQVVRYQCGSDTAQIGLPKTPFPVTYVNAGENHLLIVEIRGTHLIFVGVGSGSAARYVNSIYTWWDAPGRGTFLAAELPPDLGGMQSVLCQRVASP